MGCMEILLYIIYPKPYSISLRGTIKGALDMPESGSLREVNNQ